MKILTFAHRLEIGGTQVNAIDLAAGLRDLHGCEVVLFATPGPMAGLAKERGLRFVPAPDAYLHPSPARMRALRQLVRDERPDVIHAWDWWQCLDAYYSVHLPMGVPLVATDMMHDLVRVLPKRLWTTFGTPEMVDHARAAGRRKVDLILPPVDVHFNAPDAVDPAAFRHQFGLKDGEITLVTVSRLATWMKSESLIRTIDAVRALGRELPLRFVIVGDGAARPELERLAAQTNAELDRPAVVLTGALLDPRPAYAAADIVIGMGGSSLRGMAFGKAVIVVGEEGFSAPFNADTAESFYHSGMYGRGDGAADNARLIGQIRTLAQARGNLADIGRFSREFVERHFSLEVVSARLAALLQRAAAEKPPLRHTLADAVRTTAVYVRERRFLSPSRDKNPVNAVAELSPLTAPSGPSA
jgi:glycosyltransferase involved in cell wall biosynthesis